MSLEATIARIQFLNTALVPPSAKPAASVPATSTKPTSFSSTLNGAVAAGQTGAVGAGGGGGAGILGAARGEIGVTEEPPGSNESPRIANYRKATAGNPGPGPWCAYFVSWAAKQAGTPIGPNGSGFGSVDAVWSWAQQANRAVPAGSGKPHPGDLVVWDEHIGIVENVLPNGQIQTIEGNTSDRVARRTHSTDGVVGYVRMGR